MLEVNGEVLQSFSGNWGDYQCFEHQLPSADLLTPRFETSVDSAWGGAFVDNGEFIRYVGWEEARRLPSRLGTLRGWI